MDISKNQWRSTGGKKVLYCCSTPQNAMMYNVGGNVWVDISKLLFELGYLCVFPWFRGSFWLSKKKNLNGFNIKNVSIKSCHISKKNKNGHFIFGFFWLRSVQNGSNMIKLDQIWFPHQSNNVSIKNCHIYRKDKNGSFVFDFFGSDLSKMDQTWSNLIRYSSPI